MWPLQERLSSHYRTVSVDWPGFGDQARPAADWNPAAYAAFLEYILEAVAPSPHAVIAAGHATTYALAHACARPASLGRLVLLAPTWRGPLPTMMNGRRPFFNRLCKLVDLPVLGHLLYKLNVNRVVVRYMAAGHVYADPAWLSDERQREKLAVARARGSRFASIRFVTGELDPIDTREQFLALARRAAIPILMSMGIRRRHDRVPRWRRSRRLTVCEASVFRGASSLCTRSSPIKSRRSLRRSSCATHNADRTLENSYRVAFWHETDKPA
jgi:pimeloyl-ACP methyl ester carboxylesterase